MVSLCVSDTVNASLCKQISAEEVKEGAMQLSSFKAPGPNGFSGLFYHYLWETINGCILDTAHDFHSGRINLRSLNKTHIALIAKVRNPTKTSQYCPIGLCNMSYKILCIVFANHLKPFLDDLISHHQNDFCLKPINSRQHFDNS